MTSKIENNQKALQQPKEEFEIRIDESLLLEESEVHARIVSFLRQQPGQLYAILDSARSGEIVPMLEDSKCQFKSLYDGEAAENLANVAPYIVHFSEDDPLLDKLISDGWGEQWGIYMTSYETLDRLRHHFRHFTMVKLPDGRVGYFRFYDPGIIRVYLPACSQREIAKFCEKINIVCVEKFDGLATMVMYKSKNGSLIETNIFENQDG